jgi:RNA polymerase sigma-70 factor (ECF subfamily)
MSEPQNPVASEEELLARTCEQDQAAYEELVRRWTGRLYHLAWGMLKDRQRAEEVLQDAFFRIWTKACSYDSSLGRPASWMFSILHRLGIDRLRREKVRGSAVTSPVEDLAALAGAAPAGLGPWQKLRMEKALLALSAPQRQVIHMAYFQGLEREEMARLLGQPVGTVKTRLRDALIKLRRHFDDPGPALQSLRADAPLSPQERDGHGLP